jgi:hypothetical protein
MTNFEKTLNKTKSKMESAQVALQNATGAYKQAREAVSAEISQVKVSAENTVVELGKRLEVSIAQLKTNYKETVATVNQSTDSKVAELEGLLEKY